MIEAATKGDLPGICALLERLHLPLAGASVRESVEFQSACPASAIVMRKQLR